MDFAESYWRRPGTPPPHAADEPPPEDFRQLADSIPTLCWIARTDGFIIWYNRRWHDYCGTTPDAMEGWGWQAVHDPAELPRVMEAWAHSIATGEPFEMVFPLRGADGAFRPFLTRVAPHRGPDGQVMRWFGVNTEIGGQIAAERALAASEARFETLTEAMPQMVWSALPDGHHDYFNRQWYAFTGTPEGSTHGEGWADVFHPADRDGAWAHWRHSLETGDPYEVEYRLRHVSGDYRWVLGRALPVRDAEGAILRWIGTCTDIDERKRQSEQLQLLSRELAHRIKNIFAVMNGLIGLSGRRSPEVRAYARELSERVMALGRAHEYARPHSDESRPSLGPTTLRGLLSGLLSPYPASSEGRITVSGDDVEVDDVGATPLALLIHELATNAAKYGALSVAEGRVAVDAHRDGDMLLLRWAETGGPAVAGPPTGAGFGTRLAALAVEQQLGGRLKRDWRPEGLVVEASIQASRLMRAKA